jgi:hypothetical protein
MKARSFHMNRSSTACAARPARKTFAPCKARRLRDFPADVPGSFRSVTLTSDMKSSPPAKPGGLFRGRQLLQMAIIAGQRVLRKSMLSDSIPEWTSIAKGE